MLYRTLSRWSFGLPACRASARRSPRCRGLAAVASHVARIPVIDISDFAHKSIGTQHRIAGEVDHAFANFGFAVITGHGVPDADFDAAYDAAKQFFRQLLPAKRAFDLGLGYGYGGYVYSEESGGQLAGEANSARRSDNLESLTLRGLQHMSKGPPHFAQDMSDVPHADAVPPGMAASVARLHASLLQFKTALTTITGLSLGVQPGVLRRHFEPAKGGIRFAYYPELPAEDFADSTARGTATLGYGAHADSGSMVLLRLDRENPIGTEVWHNGEWLSVPAVPGGVVVNLGTVLSRLTGDRWQAAIHRAVRRNPFERLSMVCGAMIPDNGLTLECLTEAGELARRVTVKEYLDARVRLQRPETNPGDRDVLDFVDRLARRAAAAHA